VIPILFRRLFVVGLEWRWLSRDSGYTNIRTPPRACVNVGSNAVRLMHRHEHKIIGLARSTGGLYNKNGIDIDAILGLPTPRQPCFRNP